MVLCYAAGIGKYRQALAREFREAKPRIAVLRDRDRGENQTQAYAARAWVTTPIDSVPASLIRFSAIAPQKTNQDNDEVNVFATGVGGLIVVRLLRRGQRILPELQ